jgi:hypothetical protein
MVSDVVSDTLALGASQIEVINSSSLSKERLRGGMQGRSGIVLDLDGDGDDELVVGAPEARKRGATGGIIVYTGRRGNFRARSSTLLRGDGNLGWSLAALGDVDGDGNGDFAVGALNGSGENVSLAGTVTIYHGGWKPQPWTVLEGDNALDRFGYSLAVGDLNGDGVNDLVVGAPFHSPSPDLYQQGAVYVYFGPKYKPANAAKIPATSAAMGIGFSVAAGDINDDGVDDLLIGASGKVITYHGAKGPFAPSPAVPDVIFKSADSGFGRSMAVLRDLNGDGFRDVAVGAPQAVIANAAASGRLFILRGGSGARTVDADTASPDLLAKIDGEPISGRFATAIQVMGDIDRDGAPELAVSAEHADGSIWLMTGKIFVFSGKGLIEGATVSSATAIPGEAKDMHLGAFLAWAQKGKRLIAGAPTDMVNTGSVRLFRLGLQQ